MDRPSGLASAARALVGELGVGMRDAGELLGISHQRVQRLLGPDRSRIAG